jgi:hypothetical protein
MKRLAGKITVDFDSARQIGWAALASVLALEVAASAAGQAPGPRCLGKRATIVGTDGDDVLLDHAVAAVGGRGRGRPLRRGRGPTPGRAAPGGNGHRSVGSAAAHRGGRRAWRERLSLSANGRRPAGATTAHWDGHRPVEATAAHREQPPPSANSHRSAGFAASAIVWLRMEVTASSRCTSA